MQLRNDKDPGQSEVLFSKFSLKDPHLSLSFALFNGKFSKYGVFSNNLEGHGHEKLRGKSLDS